MECGMGAYAPTGWMKAPVFSRMVFPKGKYQCYPKHAAIERGLLQVSLTTWYSGNCLDFQMYLPPTSDRCTWASLAVSTAACLLETKSPVPLDPGFFSLVASIVMSFRCKDRNPNTVYWRAPDHKVHVRAFRWYKVKHRHCGRLIAALFGSLPGLPTLLRLGELLTMIQGSLQECYISNVYRLVVSPDNSLVRWARIRNWYERIQGASVLACTAILAGEDGNFIRSFCQWTMLWVWNLLMSHKKNTSVHEDVRLRTT